MRNPSLALFLRKAAAEIVAWIGAGLVVFGVSLVAPWAAWVAGGLALMAYGSFLARRL